MVEEVAMLHRYQLTCNGLTANFANNPPLPSTLQRDQLACYGVKLMEYLFAKNNVLLVVVSEGAAANAKTHMVLKAVVDPVQELTNNLITITSFFMVQHNGLHSAAHQ
jgi:hypothetical protein